MRHTIIAVLAISLAGAAATPLLGQTFQNPSFEQGIGVPAGWSISGDGDNQNVVKSSTTWNPGGAVAGTNWGSVQSGAPETFRYGFQAVTGFTVGQEYRISGSYAGGAFAGGVSGVSDHAVRVLSGGGTGGTVVAQINKSIQRQVTGFGWTTFDLYFVATNATMTFAFGYERNSAFNSGTATHADNLSITLLGAPCSTQHEVVGASWNKPTVTIGNDIDDAQILGGTNLDSVDTVTLVSARPGSTDMVTATIESQTGSTMTLDFATSSLPLGKYDMILEQAGCNPRRIPLAVEVTCATPSTLVNTIGNDNLGSGLGIVGDANHVITINGQNVNTGIITGIALRKSNNNNHPSRPGSNANPIVCGPLQDESGIGEIESTVSAVCDLTNAEAGYYDVVVTADHPCGSVFVGIAGGFNEGALLYLPFNSDPHSHSLINTPQAVHNGSFESGYIPEDDANELPFCDPGYTGHYEKPLHWDEDNPVSGNWSRTNDLGFGDGTNPNNCSKVALVDGDHYADQTWSAGDSALTVSFFQTIEMPASLFDGNGELIEDFQLRAVMATHGGQHPEAVTTFIDLIDGTPGAESQIFSSDPIPVPDDFLFQEDPSFVATIPAGTTWQSNPALLTVRFRSEKTATSGGNPFVIHRIDRIATGDFVNTQCRNPVADVYPEGGGPAGGDGVVDFLDFAVFQRCHTGNDVGIAAGCECLDVNQDNMINTTDFNAFEACFSGPTIPADPGCDG